MCARHDLVWLTAAGWRAVCADAQPGHAPALARWRDADWPLVARRRDADAAGDEQCLGLPLPPDPASGAKARLALRVPRGAVARCAPPLTLKAALAAARPEWREALGALQQEALGMTLRVYGSLAMQTLTGLPYVGAGSDVDLLFCPISTQQLHAGLELLGRQTEALPLDGEIIFPDGQAVAWKEWLFAVKNRNQVLVKADALVRLTDTHALLATLRQV